MNSLLEGEETFYAISYQTYAILLVFASPFLRCTSPTRMDPKLFLLVCSAR